MAGFGKHRFEALSDGVFAIAMTLLVLDLKVPEELGAGGLSHVSHGLVHGFVSFFVTFAIASIFWVFQHQLFDRMKSMSPATVVPTFVFLCLVSLLPFSTSFWGHHIKDRSAFVVYFANQFLIGLSLFAKFAVARWQALLLPGVESAALGLRLGFLCLVMATAVAAALVLPLSYIWIAPLLLALVGRGVRMRFARRHAAMAIAEPDRLVAKQP